MNVLIDTNIILDTIEARQGFFENSSRVVSLANEYNGFIAASNVTDIYYIEHKRNHSKKKTIEIIKDLLEVFNVLDTTNADCRNALRSSIQDFEDAVLVESAIRENIDVIVTINKKDFKNSPIKIYTPAEFLKIFKR